MKDTDYLPREKDEATRRVGIIFEALRGRRLYAFGGLMNEAKKALKLKDVETSDLILTDAKDETAELEEIRKGDLVQYVDKLTGEIREDLAEMVLHYSWSFDQANYIRRK